MTSFHDQQIDEFCRAIAFLPRTRFLVSPSLIDFWPLRNDRVPGNWFLLSAGFGFPSLARPSLLSPVSDVGMNSSIAFGLRHLQSLSAFCVSSLRSLFVLAHCVFLIFDCSFPFCSVFYSLSWLS
jgi:hypothetical protein